MNDKYMLYDVLETEKNIVVNTAISLNEASCTPIYDIYYEIFDAISKASKTLFNLAYNKNWYTLEQSTKTKIQQEYDKLSKVLIRINRSL